MSRAGKAIRQATRTNQLVALQIYRRLAHRYHDALFHYSNEANWAEKDGQSIWIGEGPGPKGAQDALKADAQIKQDQAEPKDGKLNG